MIAVLQSIDFDHVIGTGMCVVAAVWFAVAVVLEGRRDTEDPR